MLVRRRAFDPPSTSPLRYASNAHPLNNPPALLAEGRIVAYSGAFQATDSESWIQRKSRFHSKSRLIHLPEMRERSGKFKVRYGIVWIGIQTLAQPFKCFGIGSKQYLGESNPTHPPMSTFIARR